MLQSGVGAPGMLGRIGSQIGGRAYAVGSELRFYRNRQTSWFPPDSRRTSKGGLPVGFQHHYSAVGNNPRNSKMTANSHIYHGGGWLGR